MMLDGLVFSLTDKTGEDDAFMQNISLCVILLSLLVHSCATYKITAMVSDNPVQHSYHEATIAINKGDYEKAYEILEYTKELIAKNKASGKQKTSLGVNENNLNQLHQGCKRYLSQKYYKEGCDIVIKALNPDAVKTAMDPSATKAMHARMGVQRDNDWYAMVSASSMHVVNNANLPNYKKAIACFDNAQKIDPSYMASNIKNYRMVLDYLIAHGNSTGSGARTSSSSGCCIF